MDVLLNEAAEPMLDHVVNIIDAHSLFVAMLLLIAFGMRQRFMLIVIGARKL